MSYQRIAEPLYLFLKIDFQRNAVDFDMYPCSSSSKSSSSSSPFFSFSSSLFLCLFLSSSPFSSSSTPVTFFKLTKNRPAAFSLVVDSATLIREWNSCSITKSKFSSGDAATKSRLHPPLSEPTLSSQRSLEGSSSRIRRFLGKLDVEHNVGAVLRPLQDWRYCGLLGARTCD